MTWSPTIWALIRIGLISHPDWFVSLDYSPFPTYTFSGPDLCADERVGVYLEDHYYAHSDAAVVFKRVDHWTGQRSIYTTAMTGL